MLYVPFKQATLLLIIGIMFGLSSSVRPRAGSNLQSLYDGVRAQAKLLVNGQHMDRKIIPDRLDLNCSDCSTNQTCVNECNNFRRLMHSLTEIQNEYQKLQALEEQNMGDQEVQVLRIILDRLTSQACTLLTSKIGSQNFECSPSELLKAKAKLELLFLSERISQIITSTYHFRQLSLDSWINRYICNVSDISGILPVVRSAFGTVCS